jgi:RNA polymerase sigma-70 factor (ECF subfamily)
VSSARVIPSRTLDALYAQSGAARWDVSTRAFSDAIADSIDHRFRSEEPTARQLDDYVRSLHVADVALACACRAGNEAAWEHFIRDLRPALIAAARTIARDGSAIELADSLFADLFGLTEREGERRSLLAYYHGRARLTVWLRAVLSQRHIDAMRARQRTVSIEDERVEPAIAPSSTSSDPHTTDYVRLAQGAADAAIARLEPRDRLRLRLYYGKDLTMAQIGRAVGESEATVSRKLEKTRRQLRADVEADLTERRGLSPAAVRACLAAAAESPAIDLSAVLVEDEGRSAR